MNDYIYGSANMCEVIATTNAISDHYGKTADFPRIANDFMCMNPVLDGYGGTSPLNIPVLLENEAGVKEIKNDYPEGYILFRVPFDIEPEILVPLLTDGVREVTYEGIEMPAKDCKDGEDHCVNSKEDFFNYCGEGYWVRGYNVDEWSDAY